MRSLSLISLTLFVGCGPKLNPKNPYTIARAEMTVPLSEDLSTDAEITFPSQRRGPFPTVLLIQGRGPLDKDLSIDGPAGKSHLFRDLADDLTARGFAVVRFNKRHVRGPDDIDLPSFVRDADTHTFRDDALKVFDEALAHPQVDPKNVFVYGFGEGSTLATSVVRDRPGKVAGLILQGAIGQPYEEIVKSWFADLTPPYLARFSYRDMLDGILVGRALHSAAAAPALLATKMLAVSYTRSGERAELSPLVDSNRDGIIEIEREYIPKIDYLVELSFGPLGFLQIYAADKAIPPVPELLDASVTPPILVLQGGNDATTPPINAEHIEARLLDLSYPDYQVKLYPHLGHSLGPAGHPIDDLDRPIEARVKQDIGLWLAAHIRKK